MEYEWHPVKAADNRRKHGIAFDAITDFDWDTAVIVVDERKDYGEARFLAIGMIGQQLHSVAFTLRNAKVRVISLRAAGRKERKLFDEAR